LYSWQSAGASGQKQKICHDMIQANDPQRFFQPVCLKESLRLLLKSTDVTQTVANLKH